MRNVENPFAKVRDDDLKIKDFRGPEKNAVVAESEATRGGVIVQFDRKLSRGERVFFIGAVPIVNSASGNAIWSKGYHGFAAHVENVDDAEILPSVLCQGVGGGDGATDHYDHTQNLQ